MAASPPLPDPNRWKALALVCVAFFMVVLDVSIVNVALPSIQTDLDFSQDTLQWIITAYSLAFGGFLGGVLTEYLGWEWIFFVNVPIGAAIVLLAPRLISEGRVEGGERRIDPFAAVLVTAGLVIFVYAMSEAPDAGWLSAQTIILTIAAVVLVAVFFVLETRTEAPLVPLHFFRVRAIAVANAIGALLGAALFSGFFLLTLYMQQVLGYSALKAGFAFLATAGMAVVASAASQALVTRVGVKPVLTTGLTLLALSYFWYTRMPADGHYWVDLFPAYFASGIGLAFVFIPLSLAALSGVDDRVAGIASGLLNTSQQIGGALGVAIASTISTTHTENLIESGTSRGEALTEGFQWAFLVICAFAVAGALISAAILRSRDVPKVAEAPGAAM